MNTAMFEAEWRRITRRLREREIRFREEQRGGVVENTGAFLHRAETIIPNGAQANIQISTPEPEKEIQLEL